jgi:hypothetical protein
MDEDKKNCGCTSQKTETACCADEKKAKDESCCKSKEESCCESSANKRNGCC